MIGDYGQIGKQPSALSAPAPRPTIRWRPAHIAAMSSIVTDRIISDPKIMFGKPVIAGTRIPVEHILRCLAAGETPEQIVADYPPLTLEDIRLAQELAGS